MTAYDFDREYEYNSRARVADHAEMQARWMQEAAAYRAGHPCELDIAYGAHERQRYDVFHAESGAADRLAIYIHGGYWFRGDRKNQSHFARGLNRRGFTVAMPSYRLCPEVTVAEIIEDARAFMLAIWKRFGRKPLVIGHSAGGHLTSALVATNWSAYPGVPGDMLEGAVAISGVYDLEPLIGTSMNNDIRLTEQSARAVSTLHWPLVRKDIPVTIAVGSAETSEFVRQSRDFAKAIQKKDLSARFTEFEGANHFTVVGPMSEPGSGVVEMILEVAGRADAQSR
ncbi:MAG: alpha/beta hydrolase [Hyphomicrobiaceae bacterium]|nr:alpha/beta hydrolase [Hyphomicrobiaceae bacterium]